MGENENNVITHTRQEPDILECEVKWALGSSTTKLVEVIESQLSYLFQILKDDAGKVLHSPFAVILEPKNKVCHCFHYFPNYLP